jgi:ParB-like nuclease domain
VLEAARLDAQSYGGEREVSLDRIVGSAYEGRTRDFDPGFLPTSRRLRQRWQRVYRAMVEGPEIPPIDVYELDGFYYVIDGHHRVSVARSLGRPTITARVTEVRTRAPLGSDVDRGALLRAAEYAGFLEATGLDRVRPEARLEVSRLGRYDEMLAHIFGHRYFMGLERAAEPSIEEAAADWYDNVYLPIIKVIRRHHVLERMRGWTETDLYVEITRRWLQLGEAGAAAGPHEAVHALLRDHPPGWWWRRRPQRLE